MHVLAVANATSSHRFQKYKQKEDEYHYFILFISNGFRQQINDDNNNTMISHRIHQTQLLPRTY